MDKAFFIVVKTSQDKDHKMVVSQSKQRVKKGLSFNQDQDQKRVKFKSKPSKGLVRVQTFTVSTCFQVHDKTKKIKMWS